MAVADVPRRREGLERVIAGLATEGMPVASWDALAARPELLRDFAHLVALDPPPGGRADPLLRSGPRAHLAWGPAEAEFALLVWRAELDLRPALKATYRALRELPDTADQAALTTALRGPGRYPRLPASCARLVAVLTELGLIELDAAKRSCRLLEAGRTDLERSPTFRAAGARLTAIERALDAELPARAPARAA